jgi:gamma-glutamyltranspeptidase
MAAMRSANALNALRPGRKPFHARNPALALLDDDRTMVYGNMGGDGRPQTQSAVFTRTAVFGMNPQDAIDAPRWLLGPTWGRISDTLKPEACFPAGLIDELAHLGHDVEVVTDYDEVVGHAGAILRSSNGIFEGGAYPRSDGALASF